MGLRLEYASLYAGVNIIILLVIAALVITQRRRHKISLGDGGNEHLIRAMRAHANASEYIPAGLVGITLLASLGMQLTFISYALMAGGLLYAGLAQQL